MATVLFYARYAVTPVLSMPPCPTPSVWAARGCVPPFVKAIASWRREAENRCH